VKRGIGKSGTGLITLWIQLAEDNYFREGILDSDGREGSRSKTFVTTRGSGTKLLGT